MRLEKEISWKIWRKLTEMLWILSATVSVGFLKKSVTFPHEGKSKALRADRLHPSVRLSVGVVWSPTEPFIVYCWNSTKKFRTKICWTSMRSLKISLLTTVIIYVVCLFVCLFSWRYKPLRLYFHSLVAGFSLLVFASFLDHTTTLHSR
jgi:hypothetical protein